MGTARGEKGSDQLFTTETASCLWEEKRERKVIDHPVGVGVPPHSGQRKQKRNHRERAVKAWNFSKNDKKA